MTAFVWGNPTPGELDGVFSSFFFNSYAAAQPWLGLCKLEAGAQRLLCLQGCTLLAFCAHFKVLGPQGHLWAPSEGTEVCLEDSINSESCWEAPTLHSLWFWLLGT